MYGRFDFVQHLCMEVVVFGFACMCCTAVVLWYRSLLTSFWREMSRGEEEYPDVRRVKKTKLTKTTNRRPNNERNFVFDFLERSWLFC